MARRGGHRRRLYCCTPRRRQPPPTPMHAADDDLTRPCQRDACVTHAARARARCHTCLERLRQCLLIMHSPPRLLFFLSPARRAAAACVPPLPQGRRRCPAVQPSSAAPPARARTCYRLQPHTIAAAHPCTQHPRLRSPAYSLARVVHPSHTRALHAPRASVTAPAAHNTRTPLCCTSRRCFDGAARPLRARERQHRMPPLQLAARGATCSLSPLASHLHLAHVRVARTAWRPVAMPLPPQPTSASGAFVSRNPA